MYQHTFTQMKKQLRQLDQWLDMANDFATQKKFDPAVLLQSRLAPDQFPFVRQVQTACDTAKLSCARVTGKDAPSHPDTEQTIGELKARVSSVIAFLDTFTSKDFEGADTRKVSQPRWEGKYMFARDYFMEHAVPNFFFHLTHAYAILRHNGVNVGKKDFLGQLTMHS